MAKSNQDFEMFAGETKKLVVKVTEGNSTTPMDLAGLISAKWVMKNSSKSTSTVLVSKDTNNGISVTNAGLGELTIVVDSNDTSNLYGLFYHYAEVVDSLGNHSTILFGKVSIM